MIFFTALFCYMSIGLAQQRLSNQKMDEIHATAKANTELESNYSEEGIWKIMEFYNVDVSSLENYIYPDIWRGFNMDEENKEVCRIMLKVCQKHKKLKDKEIYKLKPYVRHYWYTTLLTEETEALEREEERKSVMARNDWSKSDYWANIQEFSKKDYTLNEKATHYYNFLLDNGISVSEIKDAYFKGSISSSYDPLSAEVYDLAYNGYLGYGVKTSIFKPTLYAAYITILKEIGWHVIEEDRTPRVNTMESSYKYDTAIYGPVFRADTFNVNRLKPVYDRVVELNKNMVWQTYVLCNLSEFQEEVDKWEQTISNCKEYPASGVIMDTILMGWDDEEKYYMQIPYKNEDGVLVPHGKCSVRHVLPQMKNAKGSHFHAYTYDVTFVVNVENGIAVSIVPSGKVQKWEEDESAGGNVGILSKAQAILNAKPIVKKTYSVKNISDLDSPAFGYDAADKKSMIDNLSLGSKRGVTNRYHPDYNLYYISDRQQLLRRYFERSSQNLILNRLQRMLIPIDMSELEIGAE